MILGFMQKFPWGDATLFKEKILHPYSEKYQKLYPDMKPKLHTIREGSRWKEGMKIHMAYGTRTKHYEQWNEGIDDLSVVKNVQTITILNRFPETRMIIINGNTLYDNYIRKGEGWLNQFAYNDGFPGPGQFWMYFNAPIFSGQIIHWTTKNM